MRHYRPAPVIILALLACGCAAETPPADTQTAASGAHAPLTHASAPMEHSASSQIPAPAQAPRPVGKAEQARQKVTISPTPEPVGVPRQAAYRVAYKSQPTPPQAKQPMDWTIKVASRDGQPLDGAKVLVFATCLKGGGQSVPPLEARDLGQGLYLAKGLTLSRTGLWLVTVEVNHQGVRDSSEVKLLLK